MPSTKVLQVNFNGGEVSDSMTGRIDDQKYQTGLSVCENFVCLPQGPIRNRPGFAFVRAAKYPGKKSRLIPFVFSGDDTFVIELGDFYARFHTHGQTLMNGNSPYEIATPWAEADLFSLHYVQSNDVLTIVHPSYAPREIRRYGTLDWRVETINFASPFEPPANVTAVRETKADNDSNENKYTFKYKVSAMSADKTSESEPSDAVEVVANLYAYGTTVRVSWDEVPGAGYYRVYKYQGGLYGFIGDTDELDILDDDIDPDMSITPKRYDNVFSQMAEILSATVTAGGTGYGNWKNGIANMGSSMVVVNSDGAKQGSTISAENTANSGYPPYPAITLTVIDAAANGAGAGATVTGIFEYSQSHRSDSEDDYYTSKVTLTGYTVTARGANYTTPRIQVKADGETQDLYVKLTKVAAATTITVTDPTGTGAVLTPVVSGGEVVGVTVKKAGSGYTNPKATVVSYGNAGSGAKVDLVARVSGDYPGTVGYFEQRRVFAALSDDPQRIIMSRSGTESDMSYSLPYADDDRISFQIAAREFNRIEHLVPLSQLLVLTSGSEIRISPLNNDAITPTSISARPQSYVGASGVQPIVVNNICVYAAARGGHIRELGYQYNAGGYMTADICLRSAHMFDFRKVLDMTQVKAPIPVIWCVSSSGELLGLTYIPEQGVASWHRHTTDGVFESCAAVAEGDEDFLYCVVRRKVNGQTVRYVERMASRQVESIEESFFVDAGGIYDGAETDTVSGLDWLEGKTVSILADGAVHPRKVVENGSVILDHPASHVVVGLPYSSNAKTLPLTTGNLPAYGLGRQKNVSRAYMRILESSGVFAGPTFDRLSEYKQRTTEQPGSPPSLKTGEINLLLSAKWTPEGTICIRQEDPLPLEILSLALEVEV